MAEAKIDLVSASQKKVNTAEAKKVEAGAKADSAKEKWAEKQAESETARRKNKKQKEKPPVKK